MPTLNWLTRGEDIGAAERAPYRLLEETPDLAAGDPKVSNVLIQSDNLEGLKALLPFYAGRVKCIYIDPPYNTRAAFEHFDDNLEHARWLATMWPRLELLRDLLADDGSIWVSIDDHEGHYLKVVMDEIFGRKNFIDTVIWRKNFSPKSSARHFSSDHDYILVFSKNSDEFQPKLMPRTERQDKAYKNPDNDPRGPWSSGDVSARNFYSHGTYSVVTPGGRVIEGPPAGMYWRVSEEKFWNMHRGGRIWWGKNGNGIPRIKRFLSEVKKGIVPQTYWSYEDVGHTQDAKKEIVALFGDDVFGAPKPERLIQRILQIATDPGDLVLDSFLGSGTAAAVAHKMGRRWIGIEMGEHAVTHCVPRLRKVVEGEQGGISQAVGWKGGGGFRFYRLGPEVFDAQGRIREGVAFPVLAAHVWFGEADRPRDGAGEAPLLGVHGGRALVLLYNGVLGDRRPRGGNVLTRAVLARLRADIAAAHPELARGAAGYPMTVYGESSRLAPETLKRERITFRQIPYDVKARA